MEDVIIVGGGAGGLSTALALTRSRRSATVIDAGDPRNAPAEAMHNYLGHDGMPPAEFLARGRAEVEGYGGRIASGRAVDTARITGGFEVVLDDGSVVQGRRLVIATGMRDELPDVPGVREGWGRSVIHCPYCHGWEVRDQRIGVLGTSAASIHQALLFSQLSDDVTLFVHSYELDVDAAAALQARHVRVVEGAIASVESLGVDALVVSPVVHPRVEAFASIGIETQLHSSGARYLSVDANGATSVAGVWAVGNVTDPSAQVITSAADGLRVGARINWDLIEATLPASH